MNDPNELEGVVRKIFVLGEMFFRRCSLPIDTCFDHLLALLTDKGTENALREVAVITLGKLCLVNEDIAKRMGKLSLLSHCSLCTGCFFQRIHFQLLIKSKRMKQMTT